MESTDTKRFLKKIKAYYSNFNIDDFDVVNEWIEVLKPYSEEDVLKEFQKHLNSEYGNSIPKLHFLTKYLLTENQKQKRENTYEYYRCNICGASVHKQDFKEHMERCDSVEYLDGLAQKIKGTGLDKNVLRQMSKDKFLTFYWKCCNSAYERMEDGLEKKVLGNAIASHNGEPIKYEMSELFEN